MAGMLDMRPIDLQPELNFFWKAFGTVLNLSEHIHSTHGNRNRDFCSCCAGRASVYVHIGRMTGNDMPVPYL